MSKTKNAKGKPDASEFFDSGGLTTDDPILPGTG